MAPNAPDRGVQRGKQMNSTRPFADRDRPVYLATHANGALLVLRLILALVFIVHGYQKVFEFGLHAMADNFVKMGAPMPQFTGPFISLLELVGGALILIGLGTRIIAFLLMCDMIGAIVLVHGKNGFSGPGGYELVLILASISLALALGGAVIT